MMHNEKYKDLLLRFAKELHDVGVSEGMKKIVQDQYTRTPNITSVSTQEDIKKFCYRHDGYVIEAVQNVKLVIRKCS